MAFNHNQSTLFRIRESDYAYYPGKILGRGYGGVIYQGIRMSDNLSIAVKILNKEVLLENQIYLPNLVKLTQKDYLEVQKQHFQANWLVEVFNVIQMDKNNICIIMQLCVCNLQEFLLTNPHLNQMQILKLMRNIVEALLLIEKEGYYFSDLKPANILITKQGEAKIGDLQSLIVIQHAGKAQNPRFHSAIFGTLHYMAPQLIELGLYSSKNYTWTLGIIIHELIYKKPPFQTIESNQFQNEAQKISTKSNFYQSLFHLSIAQAQNEKYPQCQKLISQMLRFNQKKRISLPDFYRFITDEDNLKNEEKLYIKRRRSTSQNTDDTELEQSHHPDHCEAHDRKSLSLSHSTQTKLSQKYFDSKFSVRLQSSIQITTDCQSKEKRMIHDAIAKFIQTDIFGSIQQIKSPKILLQKLTELRLQMEKALKLLFQKSTQKQESREIERKLRQIVINSKAFSHLEKTQKYSTSQNDRNLNRKQLNLLSSLRKLVQILQEPDQSVA